MKKGPFIALLVIIIIILGLVILVGMVYLNLTEEPSVADQTYLQVDLSGPIQECSATGLAGIFSNSLTIQDLWYQIERASLDYRVKGMVLKISNLDAGFAKAREIGLMLKKFRSRKKPVVAFLEYGTLKDYYLASFADKVILFKSGFFHLAGPAAEAMFVKGTLYKLGIQPDFIHTGAYKTATNMYTEDRMTPAHRESMTQLLQDVYGSVAREIATNRQLDPQKVMAILNESPLPKQEYLSQKMVDRIGYFDEVYDELKGKYPVTPFRQYLKNTSNPPFGGQKKVAVIFASGEIMMGRGGQTVFGTEAMAADLVAEYLHSARNADAVKAVVLRVDSPGGSAIASDVILREAQLLAKKKPLVISMSDVAASGGYWISLAANQIFAHPQTITGSIGVISGKFVMKGFYDKIGVSKELVKSTKYSGIFSDYTAFSPEEKAKMTEDMNEFYREFISRVSANRGLEVKQVEPLAEGRVWSGLSARTHRLVDKFGGLGDAIDEAKRLAKIPASEPTGVRLYPVKKSLFDILFSAGGVQASVPKIPEMKQMIEGLRSYFPALALPFQIRLN